MAKIYSVPIPEPSHEVDYHSDFLKDWQRNDAKYIDDVRAWIKNRNPKDKYAGVLYAHPFADGYAQYMILQSKPLALVPLPVGDAWRLPAAHERGLTMVDIKQYMDFQKAFHGGT